MFQLHPCRRPEWDTSQQLHPCVYLLAKILSLTCVSDMVTGNLYAKGTFIKLSTRG